MERRFSENSANEVFRNESDTDYTARGYVDFDDAEFR